MLRLLLLFFYGGTKGKNGRLRKSGEVVKISVWCDDGKATIDFNCSNSKVVWKVHFYVFVPSDNVNDFL